ncbi:MAG: hypothetical protein EAZ55_10385 [Cytophagales bacterium]|nr:MAG: hypothetical protein EAZ55_10385 [Cytophagales bacterium]
MKNLFLTLIFLGVATYSIAQDITKEEAKALKAELKSWTKDLGGFKKFKEDKAIAESKASSLQTEVESWQKKARERENDLKDCRMQLDAKDAKIIELQSASNNATKGGIPPQGVVFTVQIGAYKDIDLQKNGLVTSDNLNTAKDGDLNKYMVGIFDNYEQANMLRNYLKKMGVRDAWVVSFKDGARVDIKTVTGGKGVQ